MKVPEHERIRRLAIRAIADVSGSIGAPVLKGGNALAVIYHIGNRTSLDLDYSLERDFPDPHAAPGLLQTSLASRFGDAGLHMFDFSFHLRPLVPRDEQWGGYELRFKVIPAAQLSEDLERLRRTATVIGPSQERVFKVQISRHEYVGDPSVQLVDGASVRVYSPALIAAEKLRAICQQMPEYPHAKHRHPRARDFYDIHAIYREASVDLAHGPNVLLVRRVFEAKKVSWSLLGRIESTREFHRADWPSVEGAVSCLEGSFDSYFDFVVALARRLEAAGNE